MGSDSNEKTTVNGNNKIYCLLSRYRSNMNTNQDNTVLSFFVLNELL